jgi:hypothetical protein
MGRSLWEDRKGLESTTPEVVAAIDGANLLVDRFGFWPDFGDAEIISMAFNRGNLMEIFDSGDWPSTIYPSITVVFHVFDARHASDSAERKNSLVTIRFESPKRFALDGFNHQNPIVELAIIFEYSENLKTELFAVDWGGTGIHHETSFTCQKIKVISVESMLAENSC